MNQHSLSTMISLFFLPLLILSPLAITSPLSPQAANAGAVSNAPSTAGKPASEGVSTFDGVSLANIEAAPAAAAVIASAASISQTGWTATCDSAQAGNACSAAIDGNTSTFWHTEYSPTLAALPHQIVIDMKSSYTVGSVTYLPRQDGSDNGHVGEHIISLRYCSPYLPRSHNFANPRYISTDGTTFKTVAFGTWIDQTTLSTTVFTPTTARYVKLQALSEAGNRGSWTSCAELNVYTAAQALPPAPQGKGSWGPTIEFPLVPVSATIEYSTGNLLVWSSYNPSTFGGSNLVQTITAVYSPGTGLVTSTLVTNTQHDMFCEGLSMNFNGQAVATGGNSDASTSYYDSPSNAWSKGPVSSPPFHSIPRSFSLFSLFSFLFATFGLLGKGLALGIQQLSSLDGFRGSRFGGEKSSQPSFFRIPPPHNLCCYPRLD